MERARNSLPGMSREVSNSRPNLCAASLDAMPGGLGRMVQHL